MSFCRCVERRVQVLLYHFENGRNRGWGLEYMDYATWELQDRLGALLVELDAGYLLYARFKAF